MAESTSAELLSSGPDLFRIAAQIRSPTERWTMVGPAKTCLHRPTRLHSDLAALIGFDLDPHNLFLLGQDRMRAVGQKYQAGKNRGQKCHDKTCYADMGQFEKPVAFVAG